MLEIFQGNLSKKRKGKNNSAREYNPTSLHFLTTINIIVIIIVIQPIKYILQP